MKKVLICAFVLFLIAGCGGASTSSSGGDSGGGSTSFDNIGAAFNSDLSKAVVGDTNGNLITVEEGSVTWKTSDGSDIVLYYGNDGYPTRVVTGGVVICFGGWDTSANTVNVGFVLADGTTKTEHNVAVDSAMLARLSSLISTNPASAQVSAGMQKIFGFSNSDLAWAAGYGGTLLSAGLCGAAVGSAIASAGISVPAVALACASTVITFATELEIIDSNNTALRATGTTLTLIDAAQCAGAADAGACAGIVLQAAQVVIGSADDTITGQQSEIDIVEMTLPYGGGAVQVALTWRRAVDIDLHVVDPAGEEIYYAHTTSASGGYLDHDDTDGGTDAEPAIENIFWETNAPTGTYTVKVVYYSGSGSTPYEVVVMVDGEIVGSAHSGTLSSSGETQTVTTFSVP